MRKKIVALLLTCTMALSATACNPAQNSAEGGKHGGTDGGSGSGSGSSSVTVEKVDSGKLNILRSDLQITPAEKSAQIKAEYLLKNNGYSNSDEVVAILELSDDALIDRYLDGSDAQSVAEYATSRAGERHANMLASKQQALITKLENKGLITGVKYTYSTITNAIAVTTTYGNFKKLEKYSGIAKAVLSDTFDRVQAESGSTDASAIVNEVDVYPTGIYNPGSVEYTGEGTAVAVLDSGFDCSHSVFDIDLSDKTRLLYEETISDLIANGKDGTLLNAAMSSPALTVSDVYQSDKIPFAYDYAGRDADVFPFDSEHGTHVAGIIGGYDLSQGHQGIAPDTQLVLMKVFPDVGDGAPTEAILAALEDSVLLNVDAINMSLGASCGFAREADGEWANDVYDKIGETGISLITAASNSYSSGFGGEQGNTNFVTNPDSGTVGSPSTYASALSVASISGVKSKYLVANDSQVVFFHESNSISGDENDFFEELYAVQGKSADQPLELEYVTVPGVGMRVNYLSIDVEGKIALVRRGDNTFEDKALQAKLAGAIACIIYNNIDGDIIMSMGKSDHIPTISISKDDGTVLAKQSTGKIVLNYQNQAGPFMSDFSSWGPLPDLQLKPEITAHGGTIRSSVPGGEFDELSGTSMAAPNLCGIVVLIRQFLREQYPGKSWKEISVLTNQMLMSTATISLNEEGIPYSPRKQGAGLASLSNVVNTNAYLTVDDEDGNVKDKTKIELYDDPAKKGVYEMTFSVVNTSDKSVQYNLSLLGMSESVSTSDSSHVSETGHILDGGITATKKGGDGSVSGNTVTVDANGTLKVTVKYTLTAEDKNYIESHFPYGMYVEGFVKLTAVGEKEDGCIDLNAPFLAFYGDWTQAPLFDKTYYEVETEAHDVSIEDEDKLKADYFATTPYGSYYYNYIIPLGQYLYDIDTSKYDAIPATEDHIAISDYLGTIDGISVVYAGLLRNAKTMVYTITDKVTGEVMFEKVAVNARKAFSQGGSPIPNYDNLEISAFDIGLINNRQYEFKMQGYLDYGDGGINTNIRNSFSFDFYLDDEAPIIKEATYEKVYDRTLRKDRYYINLTVYDNHYVQSINPVAFPDNTTYTYLMDTPIPVYGKMGADNTVRFEITDYLENLYYDGLITSALGFAIDDYALNTNLYICSLPGTNPGSADGTFKFTTGGGVNDAPKGILTVSVDQVADLTQYLAVSDPTMDEGRDYLRYLPWSSSNTRIADVREGQVRGLRVGTATITVADPMWGKTASIQVTVRAKTSGTSAEASNPTTSVVPLADREVTDSAGSALESLRFLYFDTLFAYPRSTEISEIGETGSRVYISSIGSELDMYPGEQIKLAYDVEPWYVQSKYTFSFRSTNDATVTVDSNGVLTAVKEGVATITLSASGSNISATLRVNIKSPFVIDEARTLVAYKGMGDGNGVVEIPDDEGILYIGPYAFTLFTYDNNIKVDEDDFYANRVPYGNPYIKKVVIPEGIIEVQRHAFYNCTGLEEVVLPSSIKFIREYAFYNCTSLKTINLYEDHGSKDDNIWVEAIGAFAFSRCSSLNNIDLSHVYSIGEEGFSGATSLTTANLTALRNTGVYAFSDCTKLASVVMDPDGKTKLSEGMFAGSGLKSVDIYEKKQIPAYCFAECRSLGTVNIHNGILSIGYAAFYGCRAFTTLTLPNSNVEIGAIAFMNCTALEKIIFRANTQITLSKTVYYNIFGEVASTLGTAFGGSGITTFEVDPQNAYYEVSEDGRLLLNKARDTVILAATGAEFGVYTLPEEITRVSMGAFSGTNLTQLTITNKDLCIDDFAFAECLRLTAVNFPAEVGNLEIGAYAFATILQASKSVLAELNNLEYVKTVGDYAFARTAVTGVKIGEGATYGDAAFYDCGALITVEVGKNATFGAGAFQDCVKLQEVTMPEEGGVTFGAACFAYDEALTTIDLSTMTKIEDDMFFACTALTSAVMSSAKVIGEYAFAYCESLNHVEMPVVERIGAYAFAGDIYSIMMALLDGTAMPSDTFSPKFEEVTLPDTLQYIGEAAFAACSGLSAITIPSGVTEIADYAFAFCTALQTVDLPSGVKSVGMYAFAGCEALTAIDLGNVEEIEAYAFMGNIALESVNLSKAEYIGLGAFANCDSLSGNIVANNLLRLEAFAFEATGITGFTAPKLTYIGEGAFHETSLTEFVFSEDIEHVGAYAFAEATALKSFYFGSAKSANGKINDYAQLVNGVLYTTLPNGKLELSAVPGGMEESVLEVMEGTVRVAMYAGSGNTHIERIVLPDSLQSIGNYAFYHYTALRVVEFKSVKAPVLEDYYAEVALSESAPGYDLLHNQFSLFRWELCYVNFIDLVGAKAPISMILPANKDISGYDSIVYEAYFGKVSDAARSTYTAMQTTMREFVEYAQQIVELEQITLNHEKMILAAVTALNSVTQDYRQYGYTDAEWAEYVNAVTAARARLLELKLENASMAARDVQNRINQLPDKYRGEEEWKVFFEQLMRDYNLLSRSDKEALDITRYTAFRASYDSYDPENPDTDTPGKKGCRSELSASALLGGIAALGACMLVALPVALRKKKK